MTSTDAQWQDSAEKILAVYEAAAGDRVTHR
jgi:hypothetical protein